MTEKLSIQAEGSFPFTFYIEKALPSEEGNEMVITGCASTTNVDHDNERMSASSLVSMAEVINEQSVPLRLEHQKEDSAIIGTVFKAWVDERNSLWIKARLDKAHPATGILYKSLKDGVKLGLSVGGRVKKAVKEMVESQGKMIKTFYQVVLDEVSVTQRPANYDAWLIAKSWKKEGEEMQESPALYRDFLFENQQFDYITSFAKSIPHKAWKNLSVENNNTMFKNTKEETEEVKTKAEETETETKTKSEETETEAKTKAEETETKTKAETKPEETETTKGYATKAEVDMLKTMVAKGFDSMMHIMSKAMDVNAQDQVNPGKDKPKEEEQLTAKAESCDTETETKTKAENPFAEETDTKKKAKKSETKPEETDTTKSIASSIAKLNAISKAMGDETETSETKTKAEKDPEETEATKSMGIDDFAMAVTKAIDSMSMKLQAQGKTIPGFSKSIITAIREDEGLQEEISKMVKMPGFKKSVAMGVPYITTKEGQRFALTMTPTTDTIAKSEKTNKSFKDMYKEEYASLGE